ncbi:MAG: ferrous iron transporter B [Kofleriaceae bacterium]|nr:ferrous iron transporter B [Kofleriaceae bacterium]MBP6838044.1 ferrous iron transporter B [Kofleriaceae bacterium]
MTAPAPWVAVAGNPNVGKTTLFNALTGLRAKVSNYPGVTVDRRVGTMTVDGRTLELVDIPGTYSLVARSGEELIAIDALVGLRGGTRPAAVVVCCDATQLPRSTYLVLQCQELGLPCVVALTMVDEGAPAVDTAALATALACPVVGVTARTGLGLDALRRGVNEVVAAPPPSPHLRWTPSPALAARIAEVRAALPPTWPAVDAMALWALTSLDGDDELPDIPPAVRAAVGAPLTPALADEAVLARWAWIDRLVTPLTQAKPARGPGGAAAAPASPARTPSQERTLRLDRVLLHRVFGFAVFLAVMFVLFMSLFAWADPAITAIEELFGWVGGHARGVLPAGVVADFVVDGVIGGVGSVLVFLPQILLLFLLLGLLEDCGYLARVAFLMDRIMRTMNLNGRAFVPMLSGFACAVPAVMATRTMERKRDRLLTMLVVPLMTCSARLPVYSLVIAALIPASRSTQSLMMVGMYAFSVITALAAAWVLSRTVRPLKAKRLPFVIELPPYRWPRLADVIRMMWDKASVFLREAGTVILACTIVLWALLYFPRELPASEPDYAALVAAAPDDAARAELESAQSAAQLRHSYAGRLGRGLEPAIEPLGFDWKIGIGIIGAFAAREVFVSTMGVVYAAGADADEESTTLRQALRDERTPAGARAYTPLTGLSLMIFFALACQCMSTLAAVKRETATWRWPLFLFAYMTALAWIVSFLVFQVGRLLGAS